MSSPPLTGLKVLDLSHEPTGSPCARSLGLWGAEHLLFPPELNTAHPEGKRILLMLVQEADVLVCDEAARPMLDLALLQEYNPMLIVCIIAAGADPWAATSGILAALLHRERSGLGQQVIQALDTPPELSEVEATPGTPMELSQALSRLGYDAAAIATLHRDGIL